MVLREERRVSVSLCTGSTSLNVALEHGLERREWGECEQLCTLATSLNLACWEDIAPLLTLNCGFKTMKT